MMFFAVGNVIGAYYFQRKQVRSVMSAAPANVSQTAALRQRGSSAVSRSSFPDGMILVYSGCNASNRLRMLAASSCVKTRSPERKALTSARNDLHRSGMRTKTQNSAPGGTGGEIASMGGIIEAVLFASIPESCIVMPVTVYGEQFRSVTDAFPF